MKPRFPMMEILAATLYRAKRIMVIFKQDLSGLKITMI
ncbi:conserved hypothetical protein, partial [delta proteobacterium NaphS2]